MQGFQHATILGDCLLLMWLTLLDCGMRLFNSCQYNAEEFSYDSRPCWSRRKLRTHGIRCVILERYDFAAVKSFISALKIFLLSNATWVVQ
uniref:Secreted protein n=1 Tax=Arundo donax TaxID=35708 RepID=A0A0A9FLH7_ARUDO